MADRRAGVRAQVWVGFQLLTVLAATALVAVWGVALVYLRVGGRLVPVSLLLALLVVPLCGQGAALLGRRAGAVLPALLWLGIVLLLGSGRADGDRLIGGDSVVGLLFLVIGTLAASVTVGTYRAGPEAVATGATPQTPRGRHPYGDHGHRSDRSARPDR